VQHVFAFQRSLGFLIAFSHDDGHTKTTPAAHGSMSAPELNVLTYREKMAQDFGDRELKATRKKHPLSSNH
jgi:hypothetical protein